MERQGDDNHIGHVEDIHYIGIDKKWVNYKYNFRI